MKALTPTAPLQARAMGVLISTAAHFRVPLHLMMGKTRGIQAASDARMVACWLLRYGLRLTLVQAGEAVGRDHGTVMHALKQVEIRRALDHEFQVRTTNMLANVTASMSMRAPCDPAHKILAKALTAIRAITAWHDKAFVKAALCQITQVCAAEIQVL